MDGSIEISRPSCTCRLLSHISIRPAARDVWTYGQTSLASCGVYQYLSLFLDQTVFLLLSNRAIQKARQMGMGHLLSQMYFFRLIPTKQFIQETIFNLRRYRL